MTIYQLSLILNVDYRRIIRWTKHYGFPGKQRTLAVSSKIWVVNPSDFWLWADSHRSLINFNQIEPLVLGKEPEWVKEQRKIDSQNRIKFKLRPWTSEDDARLIALVKMQRYSYPEFASLFNRTEAAIKRRLHTLGVIDRPVYLENHNKWSDDEVNFILEASRKDIGLNVIAAKINRSELAVRGKLERINNNMQQA